MYALRKDVSMHGIKQYMTRAWNFIQLSNIYYNKEGYFIMRFTSLGDKEKVLIVKVQNSPCREISKATSFSQWMLINMIRAHNFKMPIRV